MNSSDLTKLAGAFLGTVFVLMTISIASDAIFSEHHSDKEGFVIEAAADGDSGGKAAGEAEALASIGPMLAGANAEAGQGQFKKCAACHTAENGGANKVGPNLWNIVNRAMAGANGFNYSAAIKEFGAGKTWTYDELSHFLLAPKKYIKGTAMGFAGVKKDEDRADLIAYLRSLSDSPAPLPEASQEAAPAKTE